MRVPGILFLIPALAVGSEYETVVRSDREQTSPILDILGEGSWDLSTSTNRLGIEQRTMDRDPLFLSGDLNSVFSLSERRSQGWSQQIAGAWTNPNNGTIAARVNRRLSRSYFSIIANADSTDHRYYFRNQNQTTNDPSDDSIETGSRNSSSQRLQTYWRRNTWSVLGEAGTKRESKIFAFQPHGSVRKNAGQISAQWKSIPIVTIKPFAFTEQSRWSPPALSGLPERNSRRTNLGINSQGSYSRFGWSLDTHQLRQKNDVRESWQRNTAEFEALHTWDSNPWLNSQNSVRLGIHEDSDGLGDRARTPTQEIASELSPGEKLLVGPKIQGRRFQRVPKPRDRFGDDQYLMSNLSLPAESGIRGYAGLKWTPKWGRFETGYFAEETKNTPVVILLSPTKARAEPIGRTWTRGIVSSFHTEAARFEISGRHQYQQALNDSNIPWQRGRALPGRPRQTAHLTPGVRVSSWRLQATAEYRSREYYDLTERLYYPHRTLGHLRTEYSPRSWWKVHIEAKNIHNIREGFAPNPEAGSAGETLLEPRVDSPTFITGLEVSL